MQKEVPTNWIKVFWEVYFENNSIHLPFNDIVTYFIGDDDPFWDISSFYKCWLFLKYKGSQNFAQSILLTF